MSPRLRPWLALPALAFAGALAPAGPALADSARPGDLTSEVVAITPAVEGIQVDIVGGDAFVRLRVEPGHEVEVPGYGGEPYLRVLADGTVEENQRSPAVVINRSRYGVTPEELAAADVDDRADPDWQVVGDDGEVVWHDHRTHYMGRGRPPTIDRSGLVQEWELPLVVDGTDVVVSGTVHVRDGPGPWWWLGVPLAALVSGFVAWRWGQRPLAVVTSVGGAALLVVALTAWWSLPAPARPPPTIVLLGALALVTGGVAAVVRRPPWPAVLLAGAGVSLVLAAVLGRDAVTRAIVPDLDPTWPMRLVLAAGGGVGLVALVVGVVAAVRVPPAVRSAP